MAKIDGIPFPLLSDPESTLAKQYAGISNEGYPNPSVFILRQDASVFLQKIGDGKSDRIYAKELLAHMDRMQNNDKTLPPLRGNFHRPTRLFVGTGLGLWNSSLPKQRNHFAAELNLGIMHTLGRSMGLGAEIGMLGTPQRVTRANLVFQLQMPFLEVAEMYLQIPLGLTQNFTVDLPSQGLYIGARLGAGIEITPRFFMQSELALEPNLYKLQETRYRDHRLLVRTSFGMKF